MVKRNAVEGKEVVYITQIRLMKTIEIGNEA
jgi:hypothetical protein